MDWFLIIVGTVLELMAMIVIVQLWRQKRRGKASKLLWTVVLLIPFGGLLIYAMLTLAPESQSDHTDNSSGTSETTPSD